MKPMIYRTSKINLEAILFFLNRRINQTLRYSGWTPVTMDLLGIQAAIPQGRAFKPKANAFQVLMTKCAASGLVTLGLAFGILWRDRRF